MTHYNFYFDHIEVVFENDVLFDTRKCSFLCISENLTFDLKISCHYPKNERYTKQFEAVISLINDVMATSNLRDPSILGRLRNIFLAVGRRNFGHCFVHIIK